MDIRRTLAVVDRLLYDLDQSGVTTAVNSVVESVREWASQTNESTAQAYSAAIEDLKKAVSVTSSQESQPLSFKILEDLGGKDFIGSAPYNIIRNIVRESSGPAEAKKSVVDYKAVFDTFVNNLQMLSSSLDGVGIEALELEDEAEIGVIVPGEHSNSGVKASQQIITAWARALENIADASGESRDSIKLVEVERGSLIVVFASTIAGAKAVFWIANQCLDFYSKILDIRIKTRELSSMGVSEHSTGQVEKEVEQMVELKIKTIVQGAIEEFGAQVARSASEQEKLLADATRHILDQIDRGSKFEVDFPELPVDAKNEDGEIEEVYEKAVDEEQLRRFGNTWRKIEGDDRHVLRLDPPGDDQAPEDDHDENTEGAGQEPD